MGAENTPQVKPTCTNVERVVGGILKCMASSHTVDGCQMPSTMRTSKSVPGKVRNGCNAPRRKQVWKFVRAHNRLPETCVLHTNLSIPQDILMYQRVECHCPAKLPTAEQCCGSQARQQHMTVLTPRKKAKNVLQPKGWWVGENNAQ